LENTAVFMRGSFKQFIFVLRLALNLLYGVCLFPYRAVVIPCQLFKRRMS